MAIERRDDRGVRQLSPRCRIDGNGAAAVGTRSSQTSLGLGQGCRGIVDEVLGDRS